MQKVGLDLLQLKTSSYETWIFYNNDSTCYWSDTQPTYNNVLGFWYGTYIGDPLTK